MAYSSVYLSDDGADCIVFREQISAYEEKDADSSGVSNSYADGHDCVLSVEDVAVLSRGATDELLWRELAEKNNEFQDAFVKKFAVIK